MNEGELVGDVSIMGNGWVSALGGVVVNDRCNGIRAFERIS